MKIICIGRNYVDHIHELQNEVPTEPVIFLKPETALVLKNQPFFIPDFSQDVHHEIELVVRINRVGKNIEARFAHKYYQDISVGIDFTARDLQSKLKAKGLPWERAKAFDGAAVVGEFKNIEEFNNIQNIDFSLSKNGEIVQSGNTSCMINRVDQIIEEVSKYFTLKIGDLIYTGTPAGVGPVAKNDLLEGFLGAQRLFSLSVK